MDKGAGQMKIYMSEKDVHLDAINTATIELTAENGFDKIMVWVYNGVPVESLEQLKQEVRREFAKEIKAEMEREKVSPSAAFICGIQHCQIVVDNLLKQYEVEK